MFFLVQFVSQLGLKNFLSAPKARAALGSAFDRSTEHHYGLRAIKLGQVGPVNVDNDLFPRCPGLPLSKLNTKTQR